MANLSCQKYWCRLCFIDKRSFNKSRNKLIYKDSKRTGLDVLLEFHNEAEITKIADVELDVIGINNRNLHTLKTDIDHCLHIRDKYTEQLSRFNIVAESGFSKKSGIRNVQN